MPTFRLACIATVSLFLGGCAIFNPGYPLVGCWQGEGYQPMLKADSTWLMQRKANGTFAVEVALITPGRPARKVLETGTWYGTRASYTSVTETVDGRPLRPKQPHVYRIDSFQDGQMTYLHFATGVGFSARKVSCP